MPCPLCDDRTVTVGVPASLREHAPADALSVCTSCLTVTDADEASTDADFDALSEHLPEGTAGVATLLLVDRLASLATNRESIEALVAVLEAEGVDPLLVLDRLADDPTVEPSIDLSRRRRQLEQLVL